MRYIVPLNTDAQKQLREDLEEITQHLRGLQDDYNKQHAEFEQIKKELDEEQK